MQLHHTMFIDDFSSFPHGYKILCVTINLAPDAPAWRTHASDESDRILPIWRMATAKGRRESFLTYHLDRGKSIRRRRRRSCPDMVFCCLLCLA